MRPDRKTCPDCKQTKPIEEFGLKLAGISGELAGHWQPRCQYCTRIRLASYQVARRCRQVDANRLGQMIKATKRRLAMMEQILAQKLSVAEEKA